MAEVPRKTRVIALMNQKGGVGKTTTTVNLGAALARGGAKVLLIDLDPQGHLSLHVGVDPSQIEASVYDLLLDDALAADAVIRPTDVQLDVMPAVVDLAAAEQELASEPDKQLRLKRKLKPIIDRYDYVLLDCPPSLGLLTLNGLAAASEVIVPMQAHFLALQGLSKLLETIQLVRQAMNTSLKVSGVVLAMHESHTNLAMEVVADLERFFESSRKLAMPWSNAKVYHPPIRRNIKLAECPSFGQTIFQYEPTCPGAADYEALAQSIHSGKSTPAITAVPATPVTAAVPSPPIPAAAPPIAAVAPVAKPALKAVAASVKSKPKNTPAPAKSPASAAAKKPVAVTPQKSAPTASPAPAKAAKPAKAAPVKAIKPSPKVPAIITSDVAIPAAATPAVAVAHAPASITSDFDGLDG